MAGMPARVKFGTILAESTRLYFSQNVVLPKILLIAAVTGAAIFIATMTTLLSLTAAGTSVDPLTIREVMSGQQWTIGAAGLVAFMVVLAFAFSASIHFAGGARTLGEAFRRIRSGPMQLWWLQCVVYILALKFSTFAAPLLFLLIAFVVPVALREDLGPSAAADRAWILSQGHRTAILLLELGAILTTTAFMMIASALFLRADSPFVFLPVWGHISISPVIVAFLIAPFQFLFVALTRLYTAVATPVLHARAASNVRS